ncbi:MAG: hypothetical protein WCP20_14995 [Desulfuromonadales bacterium]
MEIFGGFMVMMSIISLFLAVIWLIMPFVVFAIKGKQDRTLELLEGIDKRLAALESHLITFDPAMTKTEPSPEQIPAHTIVTCQSDTAASTPPSQKTVCQE